MKVIRKTILDKILEEISYDKEDILRIELTNKEFSDLLHIIVDEFECHFNEEKEWTIKVDDNLRNKIHLTNYFITTTMSDDYSGSYLVLKGVCVQTHSSYIE